MPNEDHVFAAARAALRARDAVEELFVSRRNMGLEPLRIGIGINTGEVVAGCVGTQKRAEYSVIGHAVNLASRLEEASAPGQILVGPETGKVLRVAFELGPTITMTLAGLPDPVLAAELVGEGRRPV